MTDSQDTMFFECGSFILTIFLQGFLWMLIALFLTIIDLRFT